MELSRAHLKQLRRLGHGRALSLEQTLLLVRRLLLARTSFRRCDATCDPNLRQCTGHFGFADVEHRCLGYLSIRSDGLYLMALLLPPIVALAVAVFMRHCMWMYVKRNTRYGFWGTRDGLFFHMGATTRQTTQRERNPGTRTRAELKQCCAG